MDRSVSPVQGSALRLKGSLHSPSLLMVKNKKQSVTKLRLDWRKHLIYMYLFTFMEMAMAPHSSTLLAWKIPWTEEPGRLQSMGFLRVGRGWATSLPLFTFIRWRRNGNPLQCSCLENPRDRGAWWAAVCGVAQSRTWLKWFSSSSSSNKVVLSHYVKILVWT